ncbi:MAG: nucleotidyl transferase AbiEii/AbiGii toxin family protein [Desulfobacteraceae bacterium]|nr:nucleotidyl transferase AbiEii/AbiGii toxin family protein [Desulfobacteraceae bacterium]
MKNISIDLSGKISETAISILIEIEKIAVKLDFSFFIVGATARDIILEYQFDIKPSRATIDIDIGVLVSGWDQFELLKNELLSLREFSPSKQKQRLLYEDNFPVDIIPFGTIAAEDGSITWPPDHENRMSIAGFQECYQHAISVKLSSNPELVVKVVSLAGLALLKLISWDDNPVRRSKDAPDLFLIMKNYLDAGNLDRLIDEAIDTFKEGDFELASARFLGRDIGDISSPVTKTILIEILEREAKAKQGHKIAMDVMQNDSYRNQSYERVVEYFNALLEGLSEHKS